MIKMPTIGEAAVDDAGPHVEGLAYVCHFVGVKQKPHGTKVHAVWVLAVPFRCPVWTAFLELCGVEFRMAVSEIVCF